MVSTTFGDELHVMQSLRAGAAGYSLKDSFQQDIASKIPNLYQGGSPISPLTARQILTRLMPPHQVHQQYETKNSQSLSPWEEQVLQLVTKGFNCDEISGLLKVSKHTVLTFVRQTHTKLEVNSKAEAIYEARQQGLLHD